MAWIGRCAWIGGGTLSLVVAFVLYVWAATTIDRVVAVEVTITGRVLDGQGHPVPGCVLIVAREYREVADPAWRTAELARLKAGQAAAERAGRSVVGETAEDGTFNLLYPLRGSYCVSALLDWLGLGRQEVVFWGDEGVAAVHPRFRPRPMRLGKPALRLGRTATGQGYVGIVDIGTVGLEEL